MEYRRILKALLKALRDIAIIFSIFIILSIIGLLIKIFIGIGMFYSILAIILLFIVVANAISYYKKGGKK